MLSDLYFYKIVHEESHHQTKKPWTLEDVPEQWRDAVAEQLENAKNNDLKGGE